MTGARRPHHHDPRRTPRRGLAPPVPVEVATAPFDVLGHQKLDSWPAKPCLTQLSRSDREALKAVYRLTKDGSGAHTGTLAESLGVSPGTVTATVKRLAERGLLEHKPYRGRRADGRRAGAPPCAAIRRHRIVERFLSDMLGYAVERGRPSRRRVRARSSAGGRGPDVRRARSTDDVPSRIPDPGAGRRPRSPRCRRCTRSSPGTSRSSRCRARPIPRSSKFLDTLGLRPGVRSRGEREASVRRTARAARRGQGPHRRREGRQPDLREERETNRHEERSSV